MSPAETQLLRQWREQGDAEAFQKLVARHTGMVYGTCRRILRNATAAEDATQVCFLKLAEMPAAVKTSLPGWLHTVATRCSLEMLRSDARRLNREMAYGQQEPNTVELEWDDISPIIDQLIEDLPEKLKLPVLRHFHEGQSHQAIARELGISRAAVSQRIKRAVEALRSGLRRRGIIQPAAVLSSMFTAHLAEAAPPTLMAALGNIALKGPALSVSAGFGEATSIFGGLLKAGGVGLCLVLGAVAVWTFTGQDDAQRDRISTAQKLDSESSDARATRGTSANTGGRLDQAANHEAVMTAIHQEPENELAQDRNVPGSIGEVGASDNSERPVGYRGELVTKDAPGQIQCTVERQDMLAPLVGETIRIVLQQIPDDPSSPPLQHGIDRVHSLEDTGLVTFDGLPLGNYELTATEGSRLASAVVELTVNVPQVETLLMLSEFVVASSIETGPFFPDDREITFAEPHYGGAPLDYWSPNLEEAVDVEPVREVGDGQAVLFHGVDQYLRATPKIPIAR